MSQFYLTLNEIIIGLALSSIKYSADTFINKAGRQGIQLRPVKSVFLWIQLSYRYEILYSVSQYIRLLSLKISREN